MNQTSQKISGLIITYNEEENILDVLKCFDFCDEIILVDSFSTDNTIVLAATHPKVEIIQNKFEDFTKQRTLALTHAKNDWVLFLDADERITPQLKDEIIQTVSKPTANDAYYFYRLFFFEGNPIRFSGTQNDKNFRLFKKSKCHYDTNKKVHETLVVQGTIGVLKNKLLHYSVKSYESYYNKIVQYGQLKGQEYYSKGKRYNVLIAYIKTAFSFFKTYILKLGFLDGKQGYLLSKLSAITTYMTYQSLQAETRKNKETSRLSKH